jgi:hypothetical protein
MTDDVGGVYVSGRSGGAFITKFDSEGQGGWLNYPVNNLWTRHFTFGSSVEAIHAAAILRSNIYVAGSFAGGSLRTSDGAQMQSAGALDVLVARLDFQGNIIELKRAGGITDDSIMAMAIDKAGNPCVTGYFQGAAKFGTETLTSGGLEDMFVARVQMAVPTLSATRTNSEVRLSWPILADGFVLESSSDLKSTFSPSGLTIQTNVSGSEFFVTAPLDGADQQFFRLRRP